MVTQVILYVLCFGGALAEKGWQSQKKKNSYSLNGIVFCFVFMIWGFLKREVLWKRRQNIFKTYF